MSLKEKWNNLNPKVKKTSLIVVGALLALFAAYSAGRLAAPEKVIEKEKIVKVVDQEAIKQAVTAARSEWEKNQTHQTITHNVYKDGVVVESTTVDTVTQKESSSYTAIDTKTDANTSHTSTTTEKEKIVERSKPRFHVGLGAGVQWNDLPSKLSADALTYEGHADVRIVGNVWAGVTVIPQLKFAGIGLSGQF